MSIVNCRQKPAAVFFSIQSYNSLDEPRDAIPPIEASGIYMYTPRDIYKNKRCCCWKGTKGIS